MDRPDPGAPAFVSTVADGDGSSTCIIESTEPIGCENTTITPVPSCRATSVATVRPTGDALTVQLNHKGAGSARVGLEVFFLE